MKQIIQNYRTGEVKLVETDIPRCSADTIIVRNRASLLSLGTERAMIELGRKSLLGKAKARPDLVRRFVEKAKKEGLIKTFEEALTRLDEPVPLGYSSSGVVVEVGQNINRFAPGDRVACIGAGYASHAEYIRIPENLCAPLPPNVSFEQASFGMLGIIALHGIRCGNLTFGTSVAVIGLGLLGQLCLQILKAYGFRVIATDLDEEKVRLSSRSGADVSVALSDFKRTCERFTVGHGVDAVILAVATDSEAPMHMAVEVSRFGGRIVCIGVTDIHPHRNELWQKEVEIIVSRAGGPGSFDPVYENKSIDYPLGYVRWTENRNLEEFLRLVSVGRVDVTPLITHRFDLAESEKAYHNIFADSDKSFIGVLFEYPETDEEPERQHSEVGPIKNYAFSVRPTAKHVYMGVIGAGLFGKAIFLPTLKNTREVDLTAIATSSSANVQHVSRKYGFKRSTTDYSEILEDPVIDAVTVLTPHRLHARMVIEALEAGKHVFVEKPLCINEEELFHIMKTSEKFGDRFLMVGYNRRFSPHASTIAKYLATRKDPLVIHYRVNAGFVPADHWVHSKDEGGSRVIGEICHFVDFMQFVTLANPTRVFAERVSGNNRSVVNDDNIVITLKFTDGSIGDITYSASGDKAFSRERIEIFCEGMAIISTDFRETVCHRSGKKTVFKTFKQEIGYREELQHFSDVLTGKAGSLITSSDIFLSTQSVFSINKSIRQNSPITIALPPL